MRESREKLTVECFSQDGVYGILEFRSDELKIG